MKYWRVSLKLGSGWLILYEGPDYEKAKWIMEQTEGICSLERI